MTDPRGRPPADGGATQARSREEDLQAGLDQMAGIVLEAQSLQEVLRYVCATAVPAIPNADGVGITLLRLDVPENRLQTLAASSPAVREVETVQYELLNEGPCISAALQKQVVSSGTLTADDRWRRFSPRAVALGFNSVLSLPMLLRENIVVGTLNCYSQSTDAFDEHAAELGQMFATAAAVAVHNSHVLERAQTKAAQLQSALVSRATIDQAIGILRSRAGSTAEEAFATLREISQHENVKLAVVAERIVTEAVRRARARHARS